MGKPACADGEILYLNQTTVLGSLSNEVVGNKSKDYSKE